MLVQDVIPDTAAVYPSIVHTCFVTIVHTKNHTPRKVVVGVVEHHIPSCKSSAHKRVLLSKNMMRFMHITHHVNEWKKSLVLTTTANTRTGTAA